MCLYCLMAHYMYINTSTKLVSNDSMQFNHNKGQFSHYVLVSIICNQDLSDLMNNIIESIAQGTIYISTVTFRILVSQESHCMI